MIPLDAAFLEEYWLILKTKISVSYQSENIVPVQPYNYLTSFMNITLMYLKL